MSKNHIKLLTIGTVISIVIYLTAFVLIRSNQLTNSPDGLPTLVSMTTHQPIDNNPSDTTDNQQLEVHTDSLAVVKSSSQPSISVAGSESEANATNNPEAIEPTTLSVFAESYESESVHIVTPSESVPNQHIIQFEPSASTEERQAYLDSINATVLNQIDSLDTVVIQLASDEPMPDSAILKLSEADHYVTAQSNEITSSDPFVAQQWALPVIKAQDGWDALPIGSSDTIIVAVIDSGVCVDHPDLIGKITTTWDFVEDDAIAQDEFGHGCAVTGIIAAQIDNQIGIAGVAPNAEIMGLRALDSEGLGLYSDVAAAVVYAVDNNAQIINMSLGGLFPSAILEEAIHYALDNGVVVIAAAGNTGNSSMTFPAAYDGVISVGSVDPSLATSSFSSTHPDIDLKAPGRDVLTTAINGGYELQSGTSFATPYVTGLAALEMAQGRSLVLHGGIAGFGDEPLTGDPDSQPIEPEYAQSQKMDPYVVDLLDNAGNVRVIVQLQEPPVAQGNYELRATAIEQTQDQLFAQLATTHFQLGHRYTYLSGFSGVIDRDAANVLAANPDVVSVTYDLPIHSHGTNTLELIKADAVHSAPHNLTGKGQTIAILDTGIDLNNPFFDKNGDGKLDRVVYGACFIREEDENGNLQNICDVEYGIEAAAGNPGSHGTNVTAIASSVAPDADIIVFRVLSGDGSGNSSDWLAALNRINAGKFNGDPFFEDIDVINMSIGTSLLYGPDNDNLADSCDAERITEYQIVNQLASIHNISMFASSGNNGSTFLNDQQEEVKNFISVPACLSDVMAVGATYDSNEDVFPPAPDTYRSALNNNELFPECFDENTTLDTITCFTNSNPWLKVVAPGTRIFVANTSYTGTSQASPQVAGTAALLGEHFESLNDPDAELTPYDIFDYIIQNGRTIADTNNGVVTSGLDALATIRTYKDSLEPSVCDTSITQLPESECDALRHLASNLGASTWTPVSGSDPIQLWFTPENNTPCGTDTTPAWYGIDCNTTRDTIIGLQFSEEIGLAGSIPYNIDDLTNLEILEFSNQAELGGVIPPTVANLNNLTTLRFMNNPQLEGPLPAFSSNSLATIEITGNSELDGRLPITLGDLNQLTTLNLSNNTLFGSIPDASLSHSLITLDLSQNRLTGDLPDLSGLTNLQLLNVNNNQLTGSIPATIGSLTSLVTLDLSHNQLSSSLPVELGASSSLNNLENLLINDNLLSGALPDMGLPAIQQFDASNNNLTGAVSPTEVINVPTLTHLNLSHNQLTQDGIYITNNALEEIDLSYNQLTGSVLVDMFNGTDFASDLPTSPLPVEQITSNLRYMNLSHNRMSGGICNDDLADTTFAGLFDDRHMMSSFEHLDLSHNNFQYWTQDCNELGGNWVDFWPGINYINLSNNNFRIAIGSQLNRLDNPDRFREHVEGLPDTFNISYNSIDFNYREFPFWSNTFEWLKRHNPSAFTTQALITSGVTIEPLTTNTARVTWDLPTARDADEQLQNVSSLETQDGHYVLLWTGVETPANPQFRGDAFTDNLTQTSVVIGNLTPVTSVSVTTEIGVYPITFSPEDPNTRNGGHPSPRSTPLNIGAITMPTSRCIGASFTMNKGATDTEASEAECLALENLYCSTTANFTDDEWINADDGWSTAFGDCSGGDAGVTVDVCTFGGITCVGNDITQINLANNNLKGQLPGSLSDIDTLTHLDVSGNELVGVIPIPLFTGAAPLEVINLSDNQFDSLRDVEAIPSEISGLNTSLIELYISDNGLSGTLPTSVTTLPNLDVLDLSGNQFNGEISDSFLNALNNIETLNLSDNLLSGNLPPQIGNLNAAITIDFSTNQLDGSIPSEIGNITTLTSLDLSNNQLTDIIPATLGSLTSLTQINLSNNQLTGEIPTGIGNLDDLTQLDISRNIFQGQFPAEITSTNLSADSLLIDFNALIRPTSGTAEASFIDVAVSGGADTAFGRQVVAPDVDTYIIAPDPNGFSVEFTPIEIISPTQPTGYYQLWCSLTVGGNTKPTALLDRSFSLGSDRMNVVGLKPDTTADCYIETIVTDLGLAGETAYQLTSAPSPIFEADSFTAQELAQINTSLPVNEGGIRINDVFNQVTGFSFTAEECVVETGGANAKAYSGGGANAKAYSGGSNLGAIIFGGGGAGARIYGQTTEGFRDLSDVDVIFGGGGANAKAYSGGVTIFIGGGANAKAYSGGGANAKAYSGGGANAKAYSGGEDGIILGGGTVGSELDTVTYLYFIDHETFDENTPEGIFDPSEQPGMTLLACNDNTTLAQNKGTTQNQVADGIADPDPADIQNQIDSTKLASFVSILAQDVRLPRRVAGEIVMEDGEIVYDNTLVFVNPITGQAFEKVGRPAGEFDPSNRDHVTIMDEFPIFNDDGIITYDDNFEPIDGTVGDDIMFIIVFKEPPPDDPDTELNISFDVFPASKSEGIPNDDALALRAIYDNLGGSDWTNHNDLDVLGGRAPWFGGYSNPCGRDGIEETMWYGITCDSTNQIVAIDLSGNNLIGELPPEIGNLESLLLLNLEKNEISGSIPSEIGQLVDLSELDLSHNLLTGNIPASITNLTKLRKRNNIKGQAEGLDIALNKLVSSNTSVTTFLSLKDPDGLSSQIQPAQNFRIGNITQTQVNLLWEPIAADGHYGVYCGLASATTLELCGETATTDDDHLTITGLFPGTAYQFELLTVIDDISDAAQPSISSRKQAVTQVKPGLSVVNGIITVTDSSALPIEYGGSGRLLPKAATISSSCDDVSGKVTRINIRGDRTNVTPEQDILFADVEGSACVAMLVTFEDISGAITTLELDDDRTDATDQAASVKVPSEHMHALSAYRYTVIFVSEGDVDINIDTFTSSAPTSLGIPPQTILEDAHLLDALPISLPQYFEDDLTDPLDLTYEVIEVDDGTPITAEIFQGQTIWIFTLPDANGTANVTVRGTDTDQLSVTETFTVTVTAVNDPIDAIDDAFTIDEDTKLVITEAELLSNDVDNDGDSVITSITHTALASEVTITFDEVERTITVSSVANFNGDVAFDYTLFGDPDTDTAQVSVTISPIDDVPIALPDVFIFDEDTTVTTTVLDNDIEVDGDDLTLTFDTSDLPAGGLVVADAISLTYTPPLNFNGSLIVPYTIDDGTSTDDTSLTLIIRPVNDHPEALDKQYETSEDTPLVVVAVDGLLNGATDPDDDTLTVNTTPVVAPEFGTVVLGSDGAFTYFPQDDFYGDDSFSYVVTDAITSSQPKTVSINVTASDDAPELSIPPAPTTDEDVVLNFSGIHVTDVDDVSLSVTLWVTSGNLNLTNTVGLTNVVGNNSQQITFDGSLAAINTAFDSLTYTPIADFNGIDTLTVIVQDSTNAEDTEILPITVQPINDAPNAQDDLTAVNTTETVMINVLLNDNAGPEDEVQTLTVISTTPPTKGTVVINPDNTITYTPIETESGNDTFTYTIQDSEGLQDTATVSVVLNVVNSAPIANNDSYTVNAGDILQVSTSQSVLLNDDPVDDDPLLVDLVSATQPANGYLTMNADGSFTYQPKSGFVGIDSFTYRADDSQLVNNLSNYATVDITVNYANGKITIAKDAVPNSNWNFPFVGAFGLFYLEDDGHNSSYGSPQSRTFANLNAGTRDNPSVMYDVKEYHLLNGLIWRLVNIECAVQNAHPDDNDALNVERRDTLTMRIRLLAGQDVRCTFVNYRVGTARVLVFNDLNGDGQHKSRGRHREPLLKHITITMRHIELNQMFTDRTNRNGVARFLGLPFGTYEVCEQVPSGWMVNGIPTDENGNACKWVEVRRGRTSDIKFANLQGSTQALSAVDPYPQLIETDDDRVIASGTWVSVEREDASDTTYLQNQSSSDSLTLQFMGTDAEIEYVAGPDFGKFVIAVDDGAHNLQVSTFVEQLETSHAVTIDTFADELTTGQVAYIEGLPDGEHTLKIVPVGGSIIAIDAIIAQALIIDDSESATVFDVTEVPTTDFPTQLPATATVVVNIPTTDAVGVITATTVQISETTTAIPTTEPVITVAIETSLPSMELTATNIPSETPLPTLEPTTTTVSSETPLPTVEPTATTIPSETPLPTLEPTATPIPTQPPTDEPEQE